MPRLTLEELDAWDRERAPVFYAAQDEDDCNLCTRYHKSTPGSDERLLAIADNDRFARALRAYRTGLDGRPLHKEWLRRDRARQIASFPEAVRERFRQLDRERGR